MQSEFLSTKTVEEILKRTLNALEEGKTQMYDVAEAARHEHNRVQQNLDQVRSEIQQAIHDVENLERKFNHFRVRLYHVNKDYELYSDNEKRSIYEEAELIREQLAAARERERILRVRRDGLEQSLMKLQEIVDKAETLVSQVGVALNYLAGNIREVNEQIENVQARYQIGQEILKGQEEERKRMAREIHDGPVQDLANLVVQMEICERLYESGRHQDAMAELTSLKRLVQGSMRDMRRIIHDLSPMTLEDLGLIPTVRKYVEEVSAQSGISIEVSVLGDEVRLESPLEVALFRTIQEAVHNSRRHANPTAVVVRIEFMPKHVTVGIFDNGIGFDLDHVRRKVKEGKHYGLLGMENRIQLLDGTLSIQSKPGSGTRIIAQLPVELSLE